MAKRSSKRRTSRKRSSLRSIFFKVQSGRSGKTFATGLRSLGEAQAWARAFVKKQTMSATYPGLRRAATAMLLDDLMITSGSHGAWPVGRVHTGKRTSKR